MSHRTGRPKAQNPKDTVIRVRLDKETTEELKECAAELQTSNSEVVRMGIKLVKSQIQKKQSTASMVEKKEGYALRTNKVSLEDKSIIS